MIRYPFSVFVNPFAKDPPADATLPSRQTRKFDYLLSMRFLGEFISSVILICVGCLGCTNTDQLQTSLHIGLVTMIIVHCFGFVSGAHANPCISLACFLLGYFTVDILLLNMVAQFLGAAVGYFLLTLLLTDDMVYGKPGLCMTIPDATITWGQAFAIEYILTAILILCWCALWDIRNSCYLDSISLRMGLLVTACCLAGGHLTGASLNPIRSLAPAIFQNDFETIGPYIISQLLAAVTVPFIWLFLFVPRCWTMPGGYDEMY